jgi:peptidyl-prolyl cis-trans isomerase C
MKKVLIPALLVLSICTVGFFGFGGKNKSTIATVGGQKITLQDLQDRLKTYPENLQSALQQKENKVKVLDQMIDEMLLINAAKNEGYTKSSEYKTQMADAEKQLLVSMLIRDKVDSKAAVSDDDVKQYYKTNQNQFGEQERRRVRHILVKTEKEAQDVLKQVKGNPGKFEEMAKKHSIDPSAQSGGDLGWFTRGQLVPEFENAAYALKRRGEISGVVKTQFGFHVIQLVDTAIRPKLSFDDVKGRIQQAILADKKRQLTNDMLTKLKEKNKIVRNDTLIN